MANSKCLLSLLLCLVIAGRVTGQPPQPQLKQMELTTSPAYVLLGVQPTNIQRPSTPRDVAAGIQSAMVNGTLQPNFALEVNPFNWSKKKTGNKYSFVANDYFSDKALPAIKKNFALSLATSAADTVVFGNLVKGTGLGYGLRMTLVPGRVNERTRLNYKGWAVAEVRELYANILNRIITRDGYKYSYEDVNRVFDQVRSSLLRRKDISDDMRQSLIDELNNYKGELAAVREQAELAGKLSEDIDRFSIMKDSALSKINRRKVPFAREGFILELAYSGVSVLQNNVWDSAVYAKTGLWITPSYRFDLGSEEDPGLIQSIDVLGVLRYIWNDKRVDAGNYLDFGVKAQFNRNDWNLSFEGVARNASEKPENEESSWTYSVISNFRYTIREDITLRLSFGSGFDGNTHTYTKPNEIIAIGGINFGFLK